MELDNPADVTRSMSLPTQLEELRVGTRDWLASAHGPSLTEENLVALHDQVAQLDRVVSEIHQTLPMLTIVLMGGTGVGKSTLLNALAGSSIAQSSIIRPTTRDPVVYVHESISSEKLNATLSQCKLCTHSRPELTQKIIVDTPDLDSNDLQNREVLEKCLKVADVVLYVGSQEKYHDQIGWQLFQEQRRHRAFAFVLNKWDRCQSTATGLTPDEDWLRDLRALGFVEPRLFRICAQRWASASNGEMPTGLPAGEQFQELVRWLEQGITEREIQAIKSRGIAQLLSRMDESLATVCPPDLSDATRSTTESWKTILEADTQDMVQALVHTVEPYQTEVEHHLTLLGQKRFTGIMSAYLGLITQVRFLGSTLRNKFRIFGSASDSKPVLASWDLGRLTSACDAMAREGHLSEREEGLQDRLLLDAQSNGLGIDWLKGRMHKIEPDSAHFAGVLRQSLEQIEMMWTKPSGTRKWFARTLLFLADWLPPLILIAAIVMMFWRYIVERLALGWVDVFFPLVAVLGSAIILHVLILICMPIKWAAIRAALEAEAKKEIHEELSRRYLGLPADVWDELSLERDRIVELRRRSSQIQQSLLHASQTDTIAPLYGESSLKGGNA